MFFQLFHNDKKPIPIPIPIPETTLQIEPSGLGAVCITDNGHPLHLHHMVEAMVDPFDEMHSIKTQSYDIS